MLKSKKVIIILLVVLIAIVAISGFLYWKQQNSVPKYETPIANMYNGIQEKDLNKYLQAFPDFLGMEEYINQSDIDSLNESLVKKYGSNLKVTYEITSKEDISEEDIKELEDEISVYYNKEIDIISGYKMDVTATFKGDTTQEDKTQTISVYNIGDNWYII